MSLNKIIRSSFLPSVPNGIPQKRFLEVGVGEILISENPVVVEYGSIEPQSASARLVRIPYPSIGPAFWPRVTDEMFVFETR